MATLTPIRYSSKNNSTFFDVGGVLITLAYEVLERRRLFVLPGTTEARLEARIGETVSASHEYAIPGSYRVGSEIGWVERGLYGFVDEVVRTAVQQRALESAEREVEAAEAEHLFFDGALESEPSVARTRAREAGRTAPESRFINDLVTRVLTATRHLTNVTSLNRDGLESYQRDRSQAIERALESTSFTAAVRVQGVLAAVEAFLEWEVESATDKKALRVKTLDYLDYLQSRHADAGPALSHRQAEVIAHEFAPAYVEIKRRHERAVKVPRDIIGHAFESFIGGGIVGYLTLSLLGEAVIENITGVSLDIPGFYIGAAYSFVAPYVRAAYGLFTRDARCERQKEALRQRISQRLDLALPSAG